MSFTLPIKISVYVPVALPLLSLTVTPTGTLENPLTSNISTAIPPEISVA